MDAVEFLKTEKRICDKHNCGECPLSSKNNGTGQGCEMFAKKSPEKYVAIVEKWSTEHPVKTRQSEFLKMFPDARCNGNGVLVLYPCDVDQKKYVQDGKHCASIKGNCDICRKEYWLAEVE